MDDNAKGYLAQFWELLTVIHLSGNKIAIEVMGARPGTANEAMGVSFVKFYLMSKRSIPCAPKDFKR